MKKEVFLRTLEEIDSRRSVKLIAVFNYETMPTIAVNEIRRGRDWDETSAGYATDLAAFKDAFENLDSDELFVFGRAPECDNRLGLESVKKCFTENGNSEENAEYYYTRNCVTISRLHCFVQRRGKGNYVLFDCSTAGTCIIL